jgi:Phage integrase family
VLDADNLRRRVLKPAARRAGVAWKGFHTFRHTCATTLFHRGVNPKQAQVWLGHHSPAFTLAVYTHLLSGDPPDVDLLEGGNTAATRPTEPGRNGDRAEGAETRMAPRPGSPELAIPSVS